MGAEESRPENSDVQPEADVSTESASADVSQPVEDQAAEAQPKVAEESKPQEAVASSAAEDAATSKEASSESAEPPVVAETSDGQSGDAPKPASDTGDAPKAKVETVKRKLKLNPSGAVGSAKAVPNLAADGSEEGAAAPAALMDDSAPKNPVEVPKVDPSLDAEMEAEIEAAMASGELGNANAGVVVTGDEALETDTPVSEETLEPGMRVNGRIQSIHGDDVFLDLGVRSPATTPVRQFEKGKKPEVGQLIEVVIDRIDAEEGLIYVNLPRGVRKISGNWDSITVGQVVDCIVDKTNKGGLEVTVSNMRAFLPASQVDLYYIEDLKPYVGEKLRVQITDVNPKKRNLVVSRRACLVEERKLAAEELWQKIAEGDTYTGTVKNMKNYGAFVDIGGLDGFLHIGEISWSRIKHPSEVLKEGQQVEVTVTNVDREKKRIGLGMRQLSQNPWLAAMEKYSKGTKVTGKVTRTTAFGAFIELEPAVEGLVHISELDHKRVGRVADVLKEGQTVETQVLEVDPDRQRISLSLKALIEKPKEEKTVVEDAAPYQRKRKGPLRGGTSKQEATGGGLFGSPKDFG